MKITLTSASGNVFSHDSFEKITLMTENGQITVLPNHEPLLSVVRPGVLSLMYRENDTEKTAQYVSGGGVLTITPDDVTIVIDALDNAEQLSDADEIEKKKQEAARLIEEYKSENPTKLDPQRAMELEYEFLRYAAMQELVKNSSVHSGRK